MKLKVKRVALKDTYTIGRFSIDGVYFADSLEDKVRDLNQDGDLNDDGEGKIFGETAIPYGKYKVELNVSPKFKRKLPRLINVPHFDGILIHAGNTPKDTHGCILIGKNTLIGKITNSRYYENILVNKIQKAIDAGEKITIEIV